MKKNPARRRRRKLTAVAKARKADPARRIGGQPENDEDARAAGLESATSETPRKSR